MTLAMKREEAVEAFLGRIKRIERELKKAGKMLATT
jgi:hypothetical protein